MTYKSKGIAQRAARKELGESARAGVHYNLHPTPEGTWTYEAIPAANEAATVAQAARKTKTPKAKGVAVVKGAIKVSAQGKREMADRIEATEPERAAQLRNEADEQVAGAKQRLAAKSGARRPAKPKKASAPKPAAPEGTSKTEMLVAMLSTAGGATSKEMETATGWQSHSVRGLLGTLKKRGVNVVSKKLKGEPTIYRIVKAAPAAAAAETVGDVI